jgi:hypothetical protein
MALVNGNCCEQLTEYAPCPCNHSSRLPSLSLCWLFLPPLAINPCAHFIVPQVLRALRGGAQAVDLHGVCRRWKRAPYLSLVLLV